MSIFTKTHQSKQVVIAIKTSLVSVIWKHRQPDHFEFQASQGYIAKPCQWTSDSRGIVFSREKPPSSLSNTKWSASKPYMQIILYRLSKLHQEKEAMTLKGDTYKALEGGSEGENDMIIF